MENNDTVSQEHKLAVGTAFGSIARFYDAWYSTPLGNYVWKVESAAIAAALSDRIEGVALDLGAGSGLSMELLLQRGAFTVGVDLSWQMIAVAREKLYTNPRADFVLADGEQLPFREGVVELVSGITVLEFLPNPPQMLEQIRKVLRPGGQLVFGILSSTSIWGIERRIRTFARRDIFALAWFPTPWQITRLLRRAAFAAIRYRGSVYACTLTPVRGLPTLAHLDKYWGKRWLSKSLGAFLVFRAKRPRVMPNPS
ncbi:MAG: methyltransferase domain-containing protein [Promethearchaeota archaeon]